ncbi:RNA polymerase II-associated protein 3 [Cyclospora cayetanensis]|uniref:RNA polymerase II-associated protein 3 n=1 Tax=Cyclospora cayetanensis TaxID=88456 RepID=A0A6P6RTN8_9EIME|nr:RNA polymerase II-associated protein 3 [Cyclospora cayetanensis]
MSLAVQAQIRRNAEELQAYLSDLRDWEESFYESAEVKKQEKRSCPDSTQKHALNEQHQLHQEQLCEGGMNDSAAPPMVNAQKTIDRTASSGVPTAHRKVDAENRKKYARDQNSLPDYYKAWDAYDPDADEEDGTNKAAGVCSGGSGTNASPVPKAQKPKPVSQVARGSRGGAQSAVGGPRMRICASTAHVSSYMETLGSPEEAGGVLDQVGALKKKANTYFGAQKYAAAVKCYTQALQQAEAEMSRGLLPAAATAAAEKLVGQLLSNRATALFYLGKLDRCIADCSAALQRTPQNPKALHRRGLALALRGQTQEALTDLTEALKASQGEQVSQQTARVQPQPQEAQQQEQVQREAQVQLQPDSESESFIPEARVVPGKESAVALEAPNAPRSCSLSERILKDIVKIRSEAQIKKLKEQQRKKMMLLQPLKGLHDPCPSGTQRSLEAIVFQPGSNKVRHYEQQQQQKELSTQMLDAAHDAKQQQHNYYQQDERPHQDRQHQQGGMLAEDQPKAQQQIEDAAFSEPVAQVHRQAASLVLSQTSQLPHVQQQDQEIQQDSKKDPPERISEPVSQALTEDETLPKQREQQHGQPQRQEEREICMHCRTSPSPVPAFNCKAPGDCACTDTRCRKLDRVAPSASQQKPSLLSGHTMVQKGPRLPRSYAAFEAQWRSAGCLLTNPSTSGEPPAICPCGGPRALLLLRMGAAEVLQGALGLCVEPDVFYECLQVLERAADSIIRRTSLQHPREVLICHPDRSPQGIHRGQGEMKREASCEELPIGMEEAPRDTLPAEEGCECCRNAAFTANAWQRAFQHLTGGARAAVTVQLGGPSCRVLLEKLQEKSRVMAAAAAAAALAVTEATRGSEQ